jgi:hypothetical protein
MLDVNTRRLGLALCAVLGALGCGDDDDSKTSVDAGAAALDGAIVTPPSTGLQTDGSVTPVTPVTADPVAAVGGLDASTPAEPPVYVAATRIFTTDGAQTTTYVQALSSIEQGTALETAKAQELAGSAELFSIDELRWVAVGDGEAPLLTQYKLDRDSKLQKGSTASLQSHGLKSFFANDLYYVSPTKAYLPDPDGAQLVTIDPSNMKVLGTVALPDTVRPGYLPVYSYDFVKRDGKVLFTVGWFDYDNDKILPETGLVVLDTATDRALRTDVDKRCAGITQPVTLASGDTYFPSSALAAASYQLGILSLEPCALRIKAGADAFDTGYVAKLRELQGGAVAGEPIPAGGDELFLRVFDATLATIKPETASWGITSQLAWRWVRWNPLTNALTKLDTLEPATADTLWFEVDGRVFGSQTAADYSSTKLIELNAPGGPRPGLTSPGFFSGLARIR